MDLMDAYDAATKIQAALRGYDVRKYAGYGMTAAKYAGYGAEATSTEQRQTATTGMPAQSAGCTVWMHHFVCFV